MIAGLLLAGLLCWLTIGGPRSCGGDTASDGPAGEAVVSPPDAPSSQGSSVALTDEKATRGEQAPSHVAATGESGPSTISESRLSAGDSPAAEFPSPTVAETGSDAPEADEEAAEDKGQSTLLVVVLDARDTPVPKVRITLRAERGGSRDALTTEGGEALFSELRGGAYTYLVQAPGGETLSSAAPVRLGEGEERTVTVRLSEGDLAIFGRVLSSEGEPLPGIEVVAVRAAAATSPEELVPLGRREHRTLAGPDGSYEILGLEDGAYELRTTPTDVYGIARALVRAGVDSAADLVVPGGAELRIYGTVTDPSGEPLAGVGIVPLGRLEVKAVTDERGSYEVHLVEDPREPGPTFLFMREGYKRTSLVPDLASSPLREVRLDAILEPEGETISVFGTVRSSDGARISGERVRLYSPLLRREFSGVSDAEGYFSIPNVEISADYHLYVEPNGRYQDYRRSPLVLTSSNSYLDVVLEPLAAGRLSGQIVNAGGHPLSNLRLWLSSDRARYRLQQVATDEQGYFAVEDVPEGRLRLETRFPLLYVQGLELAPGADESVLLVLDSGEHVLSGKVLDPLGNPVGGAQVHLGWYLRDGGVESSSSRKAVSDESGFFQFTQLGPGAHVLNVTASGYSVAQGVHDVASDAWVEVRLHPIAQ